MADATVRLFTAIEIDEATRARCTRVVDRLRREAPGVRWVAPPLLHITVKFLGDVDERDLDEVGAALAVATAAAPGPLRLRVAGIDGFPSLADPRVIFVGLDEGPGRAALADLAGDVDRALAALGFEPETRPFHAHVTLGRADRGGRPGGGGRGGGRPGGGRGQDRGGAGGPRAGALARLAVDLRADAEGLPFEARHLALFRSDLARGGPTYTRLEALRLGPG